jgi:hypothetical protein
LQSLHAGPVGKHTGTWPGVHVFKHATQVPLYVYRPSAHVWHAASAVAPAMQPGMCCPVGQLVEQIAQLNEPVECAYLPLGHVSHECADALLYVPFPQSTQVVALTVALYFPGAQAVHCPFVPEVPRGQAGTGVGLGVSDGVGLFVGYAVGLGVGLAVGEGVGLGVGDGVGGCVGVVHAPWSPVMPAVVDEHT